MATEPAGSEGVTQRRPAHVHEGELRQEGEAHHRDEGYDPALDALVRAGGQHEQGRCGYDDAARAQGQAKEHLERNGRAQDLGHGGGDGRQVGASKHDDGRRARKVLAGGLCKAGAGDNAQVRGVVLQDDEHDGGEGDHPEQGVAKLRAGRHVGRPVARVYEADGDQQAGADVAKDLLAAMASSSLGAKAGDEAACQAGRGSSRGVSVGVHGNS